MTASKNMCNNKLYKEHTRFLFERCMIECTMYDRWGEGLKNWQMRAGGQAEKAEDKKVKKEQEVPSYRPDREWSKRVWDWEIESRRWGKQPQQSTTSWFVFTRKSRGKAQDGHSAVVYRGKKEHSDGRNASRKYSGTNFSLIKTKMYEIQASTEAVVKHANMIFPCVACDKSGFTL